MSGVRHGAAVIVALLLVVIGGSVGSAPASAMTPRVELPHRRHAAACPGALGRCPSATAIVPGSVNRTSIHLRATYDVRVRLGIAARTLNGRATIRVQNRSGAGIDRLELNTVMPRLGGMRLSTTTVDGATVTPTVSRPDDPRSPRRGAPRRRHCRRRRPVPGDPALLDRRLELAVHPGQRDLEPVPLDPVGLPPDPVRSPEPRRPVRDAGQSLGPRDVPDGRAGRDRGHRLADLDLRGRADPGVHGCERARHHDVDQPLSHDERHRRRQRRPGLLPAGRAGGRVAHRGEERARRSSRHGSVRTRTRSSRSSSPRAATGWKGRASRGSRRASARRT